MQELFKDNKIQKDHLYEMTRDFDSFIKSQLAQAKENNVVKGDVPKTQYWLINGNEVVGQGVLHHRLNSDLEKFGGHIGYSIRPSFRKRGYGTILLQMMLSKANEFGLKSILLVVKEENIPSIKMVEKAGGKFKERIEDKDKVGHLLYFIEWQG